MTPPGAIAFEDSAQTFVDGLIEQFFNHTGEGGDGGDTQSPPNFWLGPINVGPVSFSKQIDDPVTSGSDSSGDGSTGVVDSPGNSK